MKLLEAIARADMLRPNAIDNSIKADWVWELEAEIAEVMDVDLPENPYPNDSDELLMPTPKDNIYPLYLCAMIDLTVEDTALYANDYVVANDAITEAKKWWRRHHLKKSGQYVRAFPWQPKVKPAEDTHEQFVLLDQELHFGSDLVATVSDNRITPDTPYRVYYSDDVEGITTEARKRQIVFTATEQPTTPLFCDIYFGDDL